MESVLVPTSRWFKRDQIDVEARSANRSANSIHSCTEPVKARKAMAGEYVVEIWAISEKTALEGC